MDFDVLFPGRFLKAGQFKGKDVTLTVRSVKIEKMPKDGGGEETKGIVAFNETPLELVLNKTNGLCIRAMFGRETDAWLGKRVTLYPTELDDDLCIRVRGSPDIAADITFELKLARKKARNVVMRKTAVGRAKPDQRAEQQHTEAKPAAPAEPERAAPPVPPSSTRPVDPSEPTRAGSPASPPPAAAQPATSQAALDSLPF